jgi:hypothetical protein
VQSIGVASREPSAIDFEAERRRAGNRRVEVFVVGGGFGADIAYLASLLARGERAQLRQAARVRERNARRSSNPVKSTGEERGSCR